MFKSKYMQQVVSTINDGKLPYHGVSITIAERGDKLVAQRWLQVSSPMTQPTWGELGTETIYSQDTPTSDIFATEKESFAQFLPKATQNNQAIKVALKNLSK